MSSLTDVGASSGDEIPSEALRAFVQSLGALIRKSVLPGNEMLRAYLIKNYHKIIDLVSAYGRREIEKEDELWDELRPHLQNTVLDSIAAGIGSQSWSLVIYEAAQHNDYNFLQRLGRRLEKRSRIFAYPGVDKIDEAICKNWERTEIFPVPLARWKATAAHLAVCWLCKEDEDSFQYDTFRKRLEGLHLKSQGPATVRKAEIAFRDGGLLLYGTTLDRVKYSLEKTAGENWWENQKISVQPDSGTP